LQPQAELWNLANGHRVSQAVYVAATLGLADLLKDGARTADQLALDAGAHPETLYRLMRALASVGVFHEDRERRFTLTPLGDGLRSDTATPLAGWASFVGRPYIWEAWGNLLHSVRTGENAFRHVHGTDVWNYRAQHPEESPIFDRAMTDLTRSANASILDAYDFGRFSTVADIAGGQGALLAGILARHTGLQGILFDQPHVVSLASDVLGAAGVADRCRIVAGSFFEAVPGGADAYVLKWIIHDWEDPEAIAILRTCGTAMTSDATLLLIERVVGAPNEDPATKFSDLNMLVAPGGKERTVEEYRALLGSAGLRLEAVTGGNPVSVIEAVPQ
jgi:O-methyltransferase domain/Dimerisation domain